MAVSWFGTQWLMIEPVQKYNLNLDENHSQNIMDLESL